MEFLIGLAAGVIVCLSVKAPAKKLTGMNNADKQVDVLSSKANRALAALKSTKNQIRHVSQKAETVHTELAQQIGDLAS